MADRFINFVLLKKFVILKAAQLETALRRRTAHMGLSIQAMEQENPEDPCVLNVSGVHLMVLSLPAPIPDDSIYHAARTSIAWPEAAKVVALHQAHLVISSVQEPEDWKQAVQFATLITLLTAEVMALTDALGVNWSMADQLVAPQTFETATQKAVAGELPVEDWIKLNFLKGENSGASSGAGVGVLTSGLKAFLGFEIEFLPSSLAVADVASRVYGLCRYMLSQGPVINDGDSVGQTEDEIIPVKLLDQGLSYAGPVMQLCLQEPELEPEPASPEPAPRLPGLGGTPYGAVGAGAEPAPVFGKRGRR